MLGCAVLRGALGFLLAVVRLVIFDDIVLSAEEGDHPCREREHHQRSHQRAQQPAEITDPFWPASAAFPVPPRAQPGSPLALPSLDSTLN